MTHLFPETHTLFYNLWSKAVGTPNYDKEQWKKLERLLEGTPTLHETTVALDRHLAVMYEEQRVQILRSFPYCMVCGRKILYYECHPKDHP